MQKNLAAVIVTFNRLDKLKDTLARTLAESFYAVVVVNNCSTDGTGEWLDQIDEPRLHVIHSPENRGGAGGFNQGFRFAAEEIPEADWLVAFDDDAYPEPGTLSQFDDLDVPNDVGSVAAAVYLPNGEISEMNRPSVNPFWHLKDFFSTIFRGRGGFHVEDEDYDRSDPMEIDASSFVGYFLRLSLLREKKIGLPRTELFIYADDIIYVLELRKAGFRHLFIPWMEFSHDCDSIVDKKGAYKPLWKAYFVTRNRIEMYRIASGLFFPIVLILRVIGFHLLAKNFEGEERVQYRRIAKIAIKHGIRRDFSWSLRDVQSL